MNSESRIRSKLGNRGAPIQCPHRNVEFVGVDKAEAYPETARMTHHLQRQLRFGGRGAAPPECRRSIHPYSRSSEW